MRYILIVKGSRHSEAGVKASRELMDARAAYNESLARAGVLLAAEELQPSSSGMRITYPVDGGMPQVTVGPFTLAKELIAGFTMIDVRSEEEAIEWAMRMPNPGGCGYGEIELRQLSEDVNLLHVSPTMALEAELRDQIDMLKKS